MSLPADLTLEAVLKRDRLITLAGLIAISALGWAYLVHMAFQMGHMEMEHMHMEMAMPQMQAWTVLDLFLLFIMWVVMMVVMMVPSAAPMVLMFARINRQRRERQRPFISTGIFLLGYILVWAGYSLAATLVQWGLHSAALLSPMMVSSSHILGGVLLVTAGIFQLTPLKQACLTRCRSPLSFLTTEWREGAGGALLMGLKHGSYCVGCCWVLMALLFVAGVMNLLWVATITIFVLAEKLVPRGDLLGRLTGAPLILAGLSLFL